MNTFEEIVAANRELLLKLLKEVLLEEDGYPTESAKTIIEIWPYDRDAKDWFSFIKNLWTTASWGWKESVEDHEYKEDSKVLRYNISTGGWSGNEELIRAMQRNNLFWGTTWVQSRRGGHYIFEILLKEHDE